MQMKYLVTKYNMKKILNNILKKYTIAFQLIKFKFLNLITKILIKSDLKNRNIIYKHKDIFKNFNIYVMLNNYNIDYFMLRRKCIHYGLKDPFKKIKILKYSIPRLVKIKKTQGTSLIDKYSISLNDLLDYYIDNKLINSNIEIKLLPIYLFINRNLNEYKLSKNDNFFLDFLNKLKKIIYFIIFKNSVFMHIFSPISLKYICKKYKKDKLFINKIERLLNIKIIRSYLIANGCSNTLSKKRLLKKLLTSKNNKKYESKLDDRKKLKLIKKDEKYIKNSIKDISSNISYSITIIFNMLLHKIFKHLYRKVYVEKIYRVKDLAMKNYKIIYVPCHKSHLDYLIISYVIYNYGLSIPYIAAGINLNIWPIKFFLKNLGAFFIHRTFKSKNYILIIKEYFIKIFSKNCSIEYFIEGKRSRSGKLLYPKTGLLNITINSFLKSNVNKNIAIIPIYINYENLIEVIFYIKELYKIKNFNYLNFKYLSLSKNCYINFGKPLIISKNYLKIKYKNLVSSKLIDKIAKKLITRINNAAIFNLIDLYTSILLSSEQHYLESNNIYKYASLYLTLLKKIKYDKEIILEKNNKKNFFNNILKSNRISHKKIYKNRFIIFLSRNQIIVNYYYYNSIKHLLVIPSLTANIILKISNIKKKI